MTSVRTAAAITALSGTPGYPARKLEWNLNSEKYWNTVLYSYKSPLDF